MQNQKGADQKPEPADIPTLDKISPQPKTPCRGAEEFQPLRSSESGFFSFFCLRWAEFFFWLGVMFLGGAICGGLFVAAFFRSRGWN